VPGDVRISFSFLLGAHRAEWATGDLGKAYSRESRVESEYKHYGVELTEFMNQQPLI
jgi:hypothetical protein